jgi:hypothetical protein
VGTVAPQRIAVGSDDLTVRRPRNGRGDAVDRGDVLDDEASSSASRMSS